MDFSGPTSRQVISENTEAIFTKFSGLVEVLKSFINRSFVLQSLKGHCHGNQLCGQICEICLPHFHSSCWHSEMDRRMTM